MNGEPRRYRKRKSRSKTASLMTIRKKSVGSDQGDIYRLNEALKCIDALFEMRLIEKLSRPTEKRIKE
jgi:hypothetical protein